ncbi:ATP-dependent DNA helicase [bacterium]|nr:ATP-dependent DNA helicase [bacterium]
MSEYLSIKDLDIREITFFLSPGDMAFTEKKIFYNLGIENPHEKREKVFEILLEKFRNKPSILKNFLYFHLNEISKNSKYKRFDKLCKYLSKEIPGLSMSEPSLSQLFKMILKDYQEGVRFNTPDNIVNTKNVEEGLKSLIKKMENQGFQERLSQKRMVKDVNEAFNHKENLLIEAPTGTGKSLGYLIPAVFHSFHSKQPVFISSYTKSLQIQLYKKEVKYLKKIFGDFKTTIFFGRENYPCLYKLNYLIIEEQGIFLDEKFFIYFGIITQLLDSFLNDTIPVFIVPKSFANEDDFLQIFSEISAKKDDCPGKKCPFYNQCPYFSAIKNIKSSNIVILNHWNLITYLAEQNYENIKVIIDEADKFESAATSCFTEEISNYYIFRVLKKISSSKSTLFKTLEDLLWDTKKIKHDAKSKFIKSVKTHLNRLRRKMMGFSKLLKGDIELNLYEGQEHEKFEQIILFLGVLKRDLYTLLTEIVDFTEDWKEILGEEFFLNARFVSVIDSLNSIYDTLTKSLAQDNIIEGTEWLAIFADDKNSGWKLSITPVIVSEILKKHFYPNFETMIFTSATIYVNNSPDYFLELLGVEEYNIKKLPGVFNLEDQMKVYIISDIPTYNFRNNNEFRKEASHILNKMVNHFNGKTLILFSSYSDMYYTYNHLKENSHRVEVLMQKSSMWSREYVNEKFKLGMNSVLLGVKAYWYGVDFPGDILQYLILYKMPYLPPYDILVKKRMEYIDDYLIKDAKLSFKQAVGRLIRREDDIGAVIILDKRIMSNHHKNVFLTELDNNVEIKFVNYEDIISLSDKFLK